MHPVRAVRVVSTGRVEIHPEHVDRSRSPLAWWLLTSRRWTAPRPINVFVIEHANGLVLFDTGQDRASVTDPGYFPAGPFRLLYSRLARFTIAEGDTLTAQLASIGYTIADVMTVVVSHLHQDHMGGLGELKHARIVVGADEVAAARSRFAALDGYLGRHIFLPGLNWAETQGEVDLFGDGSLSVLPTPGHTPGSISLLLRHAGHAPLLFVGDLTYDVRLLAAGRIPGVGSKTGLHRSTEFVARLTRDNPGLVVLAAHDPAAADLLAVATSTAVQS